MIWATHDMPGLPVVVLVPAVLSRWGGEPAMGLFSNSGYLSPLPVAKLMVAKPRLRMLLRHWVRRAASRALCTAGETSEIKTAMIEITTNSSINVKAARASARAFERRDCIDFITGSNPRGKFVLLVRTTFEEM